MRYAGIVVAVLVAWGGLTLLTSSGLSPKAVDHPRARFDALVGELQRANSAYLDARRQAAAQASEDRKSRALDAVRDGRVEVLRRMDALAEATLGTPDGGDIAIGTFNWSWELDADLDRLVKRFARLVEHYPNHPDLVDPVGSVARAYAVSGSASEWVTLLDRLSKTTRDEDLRIGTLYIMGQVQMTSGALPAAKSTFERLLAAYPRSDYGPRVKGLIFEIEHLQPGMSAPEFTTTTLEGESLSLASLRGKVVLLNFWATWCPTCLSEIPHLREVYGRLGGDATPGSASARPFEIVNVSLDEDLATLKSIVRNLNMPGIHTWERHEGANPVGRQYNVFGLPAWFLIDNQGVIRARNPFGDELERNVLAIRG